MLAWLILSFCKYNLFYLVPKIDDAEKTVLVPEKPILVSKKPDLVTEKTTLVPEKQEDGFKRPIQTQPQQRAIGGPTPISEEGEENLG
jgi:hypothetical protein